ncbi:MAG: hypothetical protein U0289_18245 [Cyclobacteriaceae bacterium]|nr:hypothetical protein [Cytophagales bacterium]HNP78481.1 hypothetical protein [Cyclobacteriaceae bacterium]
MKQILFTLSVCLLLSVTGQAQPKEAKPKKTGNEWHAAGDAFERSKAFADKWTKTLNLDTETSKKVYQLYLANTKPEDEIALGPGTDQEKKTALKENQMAFDEKMKGVLTPAQFEKYKRLK